MHWFLHLLQKAIASVTIAVGLSVSSPVADNQQATTTPIQPQIVSQTIVDSPKESVPKKEIKTNEVPPSSVPSTTPVELPLINPNQTSGSPEYIQQVDKAVAEEKIQQQIQEQVQKEKDTLIAHNNALKAQADYLERKNALDREYALKEADANDAINAKIAEMNDLWGKVQQEYSGGASMSQIQGKYDAEMRPLQKGLATLYLNLASIENGYNRALAELQ